MANEQKKDKDRNGKRVSNPPEVDPLTCEHKHTAELKDGGRVCLDCREPLLDEKSQQLCDAIARGVARELKREASAENEPPVKKKPLTLRQRLGLDPKEGEEEGKEGEAE